MPTVEDDLKGIITFFLEQLPAPKTIDFTQNLQLKPSAQRKLYLAILCVLGGVAGHRAWDPPDPVPNSEVKPRSVSAGSVVFGHAKTGKLAAPLLHYPENHETF